MFNKQIFIWLLIALLPISFPVRTVSAAAYCSEILDLANWKLTLPVGTQGSPTEIKQPALATYSADPYFMINSSGDGVQFRAPVNGVTTSGSSYPRSELREMTRTTPASWSTTSGIHTMYIDQAITAVPKAKRHIVAGQIHDAVDDVIVVRLQYPKLFIDINGVAGPTLDADYVLGKRFNVKFVAADGQIRIYYNGSLTPAYILSKSGDGNYFKAGAYTQSNTSKETDDTSGNYGEVDIYNLWVTHQTSPADTSVPAELTVAISGDGNVTPAVGTHTYGSGEVVSINANAVANWQFANWTGDVVTVADVNAANTTVTMNSNYAITANFNPVVSTLTVAVSGIGTVTPSAGSYPYPVGTPVNITAIPASGWQFNGWSGDTGTVANINLDNTTIAMNGDYHLVANFTQIPVPVNGGSGGGVGGGGISGGGGGGTTVVSDVMSGSQFVYPSTAKSADQKVRISIHKSTIAKTESGALNSISILAQRDLPESVPSWGADSRGIGVIYNLQPEGVIFDPPVDLTMKYDAEDAKQIPTGVDEKNLVIGTYDMKLGKWVMLESSVDTENNTVTAGIGHFSLYTIMARTAPASFTVSDLKITPEEVIAGEDITISATVANTGDLSGIYKIDLKIDGLVSQTREITVGGGSRETASFSLTQAQPGKHTASIGTLAGVYQVNVPKTPAAFSVTNLSISPGSVKTGEKVTVTVTVANTGGLDGTTEIALKIDGKVAGTKVTSLAGEAGDSVVFTVNDAEAGTHTVDVDGLSGSFVVEKETVITTVPASNPENIIPVAEGTQPPVTAYQSNRWLVGGSLAGLLLFTGVAFGFFKWRKRVPKGLST